MSVLLYMFMDNKMPFTLQYFIMQSFFFFYPGTYITSTQVNKIQLHSRNSSSCLPRTRCCALWWIGWPLRALSPQLAQNNSNLLRKVLCWKCRELKENRHGSKKNQKNVPGRDALGKNIHPDGWPCVFLAITLPK